MPAQAMCPSCQKMTPPLIATATAAPVPSAVIAATAAYLSASVTTASVSIAIATIVSAKALSLTKSASLQVVVWR